MVFLALRSVLAPIRKNRDTTKIAIFFRVRYLRKSKPPFGVLL